MLKKVTAILVALLLFNFLVFAQLSEEAEVVTTGEAEVSVQEEVLAPVSENLQTQHIKWQAVARSGGYVVELQQKTVSGWEDRGSWTIEEPEYDFRLPAGFYRFRIGVLNKLGKVAGTSDWAEFELVDDTQPVLHRQSFPISDDYGIPVINRSIEDENGTEVISVRGINCFTPDTSFSLIPVDNSDGSRPFKVLDTQKKVQLPVAGVNTDTHTISLQLDWSKLVPGYYNLLVEKSSGENDAFEVLVQPDRIPQFGIDALPYDAIAKARFIDTVSGDGVITVDTSNIQYNTEFILEPASNPDNPYTFESGFTRQTIRTEWNSLNNGKLSLKLDTNLLKPGWYRIIGTTPGAGSSEAAILVRADSTLSALPEIKGISCSYNKETEIISLTVKLTSPLFSKDDLNLVRLYAISEKDEFGENSRAQLHLVSADRSGKSAVFDTSVLSLQPGTHAIMLETAESARIAFITVDESYKVKLTALSDDDINRKFLIAPTDEVLAKRRAEREELMAKGFKPAEYLPAFRQDPVESWTWQQQGTAPAVMDYQAGILTMSVQSLVSNATYDSVFRLLDNDSLEMIQGSDGISFESMVTSRNNGKTKWKLSVELGSETIEIPLESSVRTLSQTVVVWEDYGIDSSDITGVKFTAQAKKSKAEGQDNGLEVYEAKTYSPGMPVEQVIIKKPYLFTRVGAYAGMCLGDDCPELYSIPHSEQYQDDRLGGAGAPTSFRLSIFDTGWFTLNAVYTPAGMGVKAMYGGEAMLSIPNRWLRPYGGVGLSYFGQHSYTEMFCGLILFDIFDIRYSDFNKAELMNTDILAKGWHSQWLQFGVSVPLRKETTEVSLVSPRTAKNKDEPVFFTDALIRAAYPVLILEMEPVYRLFLPDFMAGVRAVNTKFFAMDVIGGVCSVPVFAPGYFYAYNIQTNMQFQLPFSLFNTKFTPYAGVGIGYRLARMNNPDQLFAAPLAGLKIGKYVSFFVEGFMDEPVLKETGEVMAAAPILAPISFVMGCDSWNVGMSISIPLRGNK